MLGGRIVLILGLSFGLLGSVLLSGCGKVGPPLAPEVFAPKPVEGLVVSTTSAGVKFDWTSPSTDASGKELKSLDGYRIYRKPLKTTQDIIDESIRFELLASLDDKSIAARDEARAKARAAGNVSRRIGQPAELIKFEYLDSDVSAGQSYLYKIVPYNQADVEGEVIRGVKVTFNKEASQLSNVDLSQLETSSSLDEF